MWCSTHRKLSRKCKLEIRFRSCQIHSELIFLQHYRKESEVLAVADDFGEYLQRLFQQTETVAGALAGGSLPVMSAAGTQVSFSGLYILAGKSNVQAIAALASTISGGTLKL